MSTRQSQPHFFSFFHDTTTTEIYTFSLHDALPIFTSRPSLRSAARRSSIPTWPWRIGAPPSPRSEEHTSELQSRLHLVCRLLLEKKKRLPGKLYLRFTDPAAARLMPTDSNACRSAA